MKMTDKYNLQQMYLIIELFKIGCEWQGDIFSKKWRENLIIPHLDDGTVNVHIRAEVMDMLKGYEEGVDWRWQGEGEISILIA